MPRISLVTAQRGPGIVQYPGVPSPVPIVSGGEQITESGLRLMAIQERLQEQQDRIDLFRAVTETETELKQRQLDLSADPNYATHVTRFKPAASEIIARKGETLKGAVYTTYRAHAERLAAEIGIHVEVDAKKRQAEQQRVDTITLGKPSALRWAAADTAEKRETIERDYLALVDLNIEDPKMKYTVGENWKTLAKTELKTLVKERIENDVLTTQKDLLAGRYDDLLEKSDVVELRNVATRQKRENEEEARRVKHEGQEQTDMTLLGAFRAGKLTPSSIAKSGLPPDRQLFWDNHLERQQEKPYRESNLRVYADTLKTILQQPGQTSPAAILAKMGKGLSIENAMSAVSLWQKVTEVKEIAPAQYDPHRQALLMWESMKDSYVFAPNEMLADANDVRSGTAKAGPNLKFQNDLNAQKVLDAFLLRIERGEEPRKVLQELVKPYLEREAPGFLSRWSSWLLGKPAAITDDANLRQQATEFLRGHKLPQTEESLRRTTEFLKKKGKK